jgi:hypothetical protein
MNTVRRWWRWDLFQSAILTLWVGFNVSLMFYSLSLRTTEWSWKSDVTCVMSLVAAFVFYIEAMLAIHWWYHQDGTLAVPCALSGMAVTSVFGVVDVVRHVPSCWPWTVAETLTVVCWEGLIIVVLFRILWLMRTVVKSDSEMNA